MPATALNLRRDLGLLETTTITAGSMIGAGIFFVPNIVAREFGDPIVVLAIWLIGGLFSLAGALTIAELAAMFPRSGGIYHFVREAYGEGVGFVSGWAYFLFAKAAFGAAVAIVFAQHVSFFVPLGSTQVTLMAAWVLGLFTFINYAGVRFTGQVQNLLTVLKVAALLAIVGLALVLTPETRPSASSAAATGTLSAALAAVLFAYNAWINATLVAEEVREPERNLPRALVLGVSIVIVVYLATNWAYLHVLGVDGVAGSALVGAETAGALVGFGATFVAAAVLISSAGNLNGGLMTGGRIPLAMAEQRQLPALLGRTSRFATPGWALGLQLAISWALLLTGTFEAIITYAIFVVWAILLMAGLAVIVLRRTRPDAARPYRVPWYPVMPIAFALAASFVVIQTLIEQPSAALLGLVISATGLPLYLWARRGQPD